jgi:hypothetical protein
MIISTFNQFTICDDNSFDSKGGVQAGGSHGLKKCLT